MLSPEQNNPTTIIGSPQYDHAVPTGYVTPENLNVELCHPLSSNQNGHYVSEMEARWPPSMTKSQSSWLHPRSLFCDNQTPVPDSDYPMYTNEGKPI